MTGSADDSPDQERPAQERPAQERPGAVPKPDAGRPTILRNLRAFDRWKDDDEEDDAGPAEAAPGAGPATTGPADLARDDVGPGDVGPGADAPTTVARPTADPVHADAPTTVAPSTADPVYADAPTTLGPPTADPVYADAPTTAEPVHAAPVHAAPVPPTCRTADGRTELALDQEHMVVEEEENKPRSPLRSLVEWVVVIVGALVVATIIKTFLFQAFWIPSDSMLPTLEVKDRVLVNKLSYDLHDVHRGDVIVFERPPGETEKIKDLIKRVIATEGDTLTLQDGKVLVNGKAIDEPYIAEGAETVNICAFTGTVKVPEGHVFVMGDNRENSKDSRCFGPIDEDLIVGRAFIRVWPLNALGTL